MKLSLAEVTAAASVLLVSGCSGHYSTLDPAGPSAQAVAWIWWGMLAVSSLVLIAVCVLWWYATRRKTRDYSDSEAQHIQNRWVVGGGVGLPVLSMTVLLAFGIPVGHKMLPWPDENALQIEVHAQQWFWEVRYPEHGIELTDEIHIPVGTAVDFHVSSADVIHAFWVPRLGGKIDAIPGRTNVVRLQADEAGRFGGLCAEYCGQAHAFMTFEVVAHSEADFNAWLTEQNEGDNEQ
ncbi:cytochrome c oxidase subunit II [Aliidiomarina sp. Khilg15.8]